MNPEPSNKIPNLSKLSHDDLNKRDIFGRSILHLVIVSNRYDLLRNLLKNPHVKSILLLCDFENGWNCLHYVIFYKKLSCFKVLMDFLKSSNCLSDLLKAKDRNNVTPLQLLNNDFKNLVWLPQYINEKNQYHLTYRFTNHPNHQPEQTDTPNTEDTEPNQQNGSETNRDSVPVESGNGTPPTAQTKKTRIPYHQLPWSTRRCGSEIYMFGVNDRYQMGVGKHEDVSVPIQLLHENFKDREPEESTQTRLMKPRYKQIAISKNHSLALTKDGQLFSSGIGSGGRLGHGADNSNYSQHKLIEFFSEEEKYIREVSISNNHSIAVTSNNEIYGWGLNSYNQLGFNSVTNAKDFRDIFESEPSLILGDLKKNYLPIKGIATSKVHSIAFTKQDLYFWGLNIGQMGIPAHSPDLELKQNDLVFRGEVVTSPKIVTLRDEIKLVDTCDTCTVLVTERNDIHLYYQYQHVKLPKIPVRGSNNINFDYFKPSRLTKPIEIKKIVMRSSDYCVILLETGDIFTFKINIKDLKNVKYNQVWRAYDQDMAVSDVDISEDGSIVLCTRNGSVFIKSTQSSTTRKSISESTLAIPIAKNKFKKIDHLNKIVKVTCDSRFFSFGFIRDDIDPLPFKLQKNDFLDDISYLSPLNNVELHRKQDQLLKIDHTTNTYISRFIYPNRSRNDEEDDDEEEHNRKEKHDNDVEDILYQLNQERFDPFASKREKITDTFEKLSEEETTYLLNELKSDLAFIISKYTLQGEENHKGYDCFITLEDFPKLKIGIHKGIFAARSKIFRRIFNPVDNDEVFLEDDFLARYDKISRSFHISSKVNIISLLIFIHFIYTNSVLEIWSEYKLLTGYPHIQAIRNEYELLLQIFSVPTQSKEKQFLEDFSSELSKSLNLSLGDVLIKLGDGEIRCHSYILKARSAFFETLLSCRWESSNENTLDFSGLSKFQFNFILQHLYGQNNYDIFDYFQFQFEEADEFVNTLLEMIEIADELLLFQLKSLCQLAITDFMTLDNVLILLVHSDFLSAPKLFMNCCWYIYNNLEILLFDDGLKELSFELLKKLETQINFFQNCQRINFSDENGVLNEKMLNNWFENESNFLIAKFLNNVEIFNECFISDRKNCFYFEPLVDSKYLTASKEAAPKKRRNSSKVSLTSEVEKFRNSITNIEKEKEHAAVAVESDAGFAVVKKGTRRKSSAVPKSKSPTPDFKPSTKEEYKPNINTTPTFSWANGQSQSHSNGEQKTLQLSQLINANGVEVKQYNNSNSGISPYSNWANPSKGTPILNDIDPISKASDSGIAFNVSKKAQKLRMGPMIKLSQKERKRLGSGSNNGVLPIASHEDKSKNPWGSTDSLVSGIGASSTSMNPVISNDYTQALPVLGSNKSKAGKGSKANVDAKSKSAHSPHSTSVFPIPIVNSGASSRGPDSMTSSYSETPSLTEIMIQESLKLEQSRINESERKTIKEIQQEEEFAKWWQEESLKVQRQMNDYSPFKSQTSSKESNRTKTRNKKRFDTQKSEAKTGSLETSSAKDKLLENVTKTKFRSKSKFNQPRHGNKSAENLSN